MTIKSSTIFLLVLFGSLCVQSQAWIREKGSCYYQIGYSVLSSDSRYNGSASEIDLPYTISDRTLEVYTEQGLGNKWMVSLHFPYRFLSNQGNKASHIETVIQTGSLSSLGNIVLNGLYGIEQEGKLKISAKLGLSLPTASFDKDLGLRTGDDATGFTGSLNLGFPFGSIQTSMTGRNNGYSEYLTQMLELGGELKNNFYVFAGHQFRYSFKNGDFNETTTQETGIHANDTEFWAYSLKFGYKIKEHFFGWLYASGGYAGNYVLRSPAFSLSVAYQK